MFDIEVRFKIGQRQVSWNEFLGIFLTEALRPSFEKLRLQFAPMPALTRQSAVEHESLAPQPRVVGINEAARLLSLRPTTIRAYVACRKISSVRIGRRVLIPTEAINELIVTGLTPAKPCN
jgi:excisionase family DNA binding protein